MTQYERVYQELVKDPLATMKEIGERVGVNKNTVNGYVRYGGANNITSLRREILNTYWQRKPQSKKETS